MVSGSGLWRWHRRQLRPGNGTRSLNQINRVASFDEMNVLHTYPFTPNQCILFIKTSTRGIRSPRCRAHGPTAPDANHQYRGLCMTRVGRRPFPVWRTHLSAALGGAASALWARTLDRLRYGFGSAGQAPSGRPKPRRGPPRSSARRPTRDGGLPQRRYASYQAYVDHQASKLTQIERRLRRVEAEDLESFRTRFADCTALEGRHTVLCWGRGWAPRCGL